MTLSLNPRVLQVRSQEDIGLINQLLSSSDRPFIKLIPDQTLITEGQSRCYDSHKQAARACDNSYAYVYSADGDGFSINLSKLGTEGDAIIAQWFDPREGVYHKIEETYERKMNQRFNPPETRTANNDWVLVLCASKVK